MTSSATARSGHLAITIALTGRIQTLRHAAANSREMIPRALTDSYRAELHYMRGPRRQMARVAYSNPPRIIAPPRAKSNRPP
jgi:hypothetical protein